jgi:hypothetical protein
MKTKKQDQKAREWDEARRRHHLSHAQAQMARELGMNPRKLGKIDNHKQEPWKAPLPLFIEELYFKRFGRTRPLVQPGGAQQQGPQTKSTPTPLQHGGTEEAEEIW